MDPDPWLGGSLALALFLLGVNAWLSALETAVINARRSRLAQVGPPARVQRAERLIESPDEFQSSAHLSKSLNESLIYAAAVVVGLCLTADERAPVAIAELLATAWPVLLVAAVCAYFCVTLLGEALPKSWAALAPEGLLLRSLGFIQVFTLAFTPVRWATSRLGRLVWRSAGGDPVLTSRAAHSEEEIKLLVEGSAEEGVLEEDEKEMIHSIFEFTDTVARQVMTPRIDIYSVEADATMEEVLQEAMESGHSRLPVYEGTMDQIVGVIHVKDLLPQLLGGHSTAVRQLMREPYFVPEGKPIDELLQEFRAAKSQLAIVVDEFGGTSGLVTIEDVLEEIVGEIEDEYDTETEPTAQLSDTGEGTLVDARMTIDDVNEELNLCLPEGDYDTFGGFVFSLFGRPAIPGESIRYENLEFVVEAVERLRLQKIRIVQLAPQAQEAENGASVEA
ncbi:MAG: hemolysin family protein [Armatimonadota bacterium]